MLKAALGGVAGIALGAPYLNGAQAPTPAPVGAAGTGTLKLADDLFILRLPGEANVLAQTSAAGLLLVDGGSAAGADALLKTLSGLPNGGRIHTLFNTHWHREQTGLNERLGKLGSTTIIAHENTRLWLTIDVTWPWNGQRFDPLPKVAQPNKTFYESGKLDSGVRYGYISDAAHTDGDLYVHFPDRNVVAVGDAVSGEGWPVVDWWTGGWIGGMVGGLHRVMTLCDADTRIVPARGPVLNLTALREQYDMYGTIYDRLSQLLNKGRGPSEAVEAKPTKEFDARMGNPDEFVRRAFESLWAYTSPDA